MTLYHGTRRGFGPGGYLIPRSQHGQPGTTAPLVPGRVQPSDVADWVYVTEDIDLAWVYAWHAPGRGQPKVLEVEPMGELHDDLEHGLRMRAYRCTMARVRKIHRVPTVTEADARGGWVL